MKGRFDKPIKSKAFSHNPNPVDENPLDNKAATTTNKSFESASWKISIVYEDPNMVVIDKPFGLALHGGEGVSISVIKILQLQSKSYFPIHRLDKATGGLVVMAKNPAFASKCGRLMKTIQKRYYAIVKGRFSKTVHRVHVPISVEGVLKQAETHFEVLCSFSRYSLLRIRLVTGRKHQIRLHLQAMGHPLCGDTKAGDFSLNRLIAQKMGYKQLYLYCYQLQLPFYKKLNLQQDLPIVFRQFMNAHGSGNIGGDFGSDKQ